MVILNYDTVPQNPPVGYIEFAVNMNSLDNSKQFWMWLKESSSGAKVIAWDIVFDEVGCYSASATPMRVRDDEIVTRYVGPTHHIVSDVWFRHAELLKEEDVRRRINGEAFRNNNRRRDGSAPNAPAISNEGFARRRAALAAAAAESDLRLKCLAPASERSQAPWLSGSQHHRGPVLRCPAELRSQYQIVFVQGYVLLRACFHWRVLPALVALPRMRPGGEDASIVVTETVV
ncbi:hypothetical protein DFH09DRAFT_1085869 [Mycena vulgaris]|nr:hypothetical protein DFH09DRAFT_1085869 [Mycena vulgaris]